MDCTELRRVALRCVVGKATALYLALRSGGVD
jgi:hypothetical protein